MVRRLRESGVTVVLTTHYIEEAEDMADRVGVISHGKIILVEDKGHTDAQVSEHRCCRPVRLAVPYEPDHGSVSTSRSSVGSRTGAPTLGAGGCSSAFALARNPAAVITLSGDTTNSPRQFLMSLDTCPPRRWAVGAVVGLE